MFSATTDQPAFEADYRNRNNGLIYETNKRQAPGAKISEQMDFSKPDAAGAKALNEVLWRDQKGEVPMPTPQHTIFPAGND
jgi:hypothetical protein